MSPALLFILGALMTLIVAAAVGPLLYAMVLDGRDGEAEGAVESTPPAARHAVDILQAARTAGRLDTLVKAIDRAGLSTVLEGRGPYTMFAPSDEAFAKLPAGVVESLLSEPDTLHDVVNYHLVPALMRAADIRGCASAETLQGEDLAFSNNGTVRVDGARLVSGDIEASNGVIHVIDRVLLPARI